MLTTFVASYLSPDDDGDRAELMTQLRKMATRDGDNLWLAEDVAVCCLHGGGH